MENCSSPVQRRDETEMKHYAEVKPSVPWGLHQKAQSRNSLSIQRKQRTFIKEKWKGYFFKITSTSFDFSHECIILASSKDSAMQLGLQRQYYQIT